MADGLFHSLVADMKFVLLHETKNDEGIKSFFMDIWEGYVKVRLSDEEPGSVLTKTLDRHEPIPHGTHGHS